MYSVSKCLILCGLIFLTLISLIPEPVEACSCMPEHPQNHYCKADYVIIARVLRKSNRLVRKNVAYKIEIKKSYKINEKAQRDLKNGRVITSADSAMCGVELEVGKLYVIAGRGPRLSLCNYVKEYLKMSIVERRGFAGAYRKGCECKITTCFPPYCGQPRASCNWSPFSKCETSYSACVPGKDIQTPEGSIADCHWRRSQPYKDCLSQP